MRRAQSSNEYILLVALIVILLIPLIHFAYSNKGETKIVDLDEAVQGLASAADSVYALGPGNSMNVYVTIPAGVASDRDPVIQNNTLAYYAYIGGNLETVSAYASPVIQGKLPTEPGNYKLTVEMTEGGVCIYQTIQEKNEHCYCFNPANSDDPELQYISGTSLKVQCNYNDQYQDCAAAGPGDFIRFMRASCTDTQNDQNVWYRIIRNGQTVSGAMLATLNQTDGLYYAEMNYTIPQSGEFQFNVVCKDQCFDLTSLDQFSSEVNVGEGRLVPYVIDPNDGVTRIYSNDPPVGTLFTNNPGDTISMRTGVECRYGATCSNIVATMDPFLNE